MTTSGTKTRALCVATRCTSVDQFVATFHRFCDDDQTFFVATMTSRPVGLETAFSIQLADKQPVLRGLCIVLDAWATSENRYKRPGIRLGIKRLTSDSQLVFDRLRAASKSPAAIAQAEPAPGPPLPAIAPVSRPPAFPLRATGDPSPLPRVSGPRIEPPVRATMAKAPPGRALRPIPAPPAPPAVEPSPSPVAARSPEASSSPEPSPPPEPAPIAITRFQVALNVGASPPPVDDVAFQSTQLVSRTETDPRTINDQAVGEAPAHPGTPARGGDQPNEPSARPVHDTMPNVAVVEPLAPMPDLAARDDLRTPGSALVLPANPLQNLSDESLEGFVDCTLYEETGNIFHPAVDGGDWNDEVADPPMARLAQATPPASVPVMPFDAPPNLTVREVGNTESLALAPGEPTPAPGSQEALRLALASTAAMPTLPHHGRASSDAPRLDVVSAARGMGAVPRSPHPAWGTAPENPATAMPMHGHAVAIASPPAHPTVDATPYSHYTAPPPAGLPQLAPVRVAEAWQRWLLIGGSAVVAIVVAFVLARLVRGPNRAELAAVGSAAVVDPRAKAVPVTRPNEQARSGTGASQAAGHDRRAPIPAAPAPPASSADPPADPVPPEPDGEPASGETPVVGSGPCRFTVATTPAGSMVRVDEQAMGPSPITIADTCDKHKIEVSHARYENLTRWVTLAADKPRQLDITLRRPIHEVTVTSSPPGAQVSIDGNRAGTTPTVIKMMGFSRVNLTFTKAGFRRVTKEVYSKLREDRVFVKLIR